MVEIFFKSNTSGFPPFELALFFGDFPLEIRASILKDRMRDKFDDLVQDLLLLLSMRFFSMTCLGIALQVSL